MTQQVLSYATPLWIADNQIAAIAGVLKDPKKVEAIHAQLVANDQSLIEDPNLFYEHADRQVRVWGNKTLGNAFMAVAEFPAVQHPPHGGLSVATKGAMLLAFRDCCNGCGTSFNAALLTTNQDQFQFFGANPRTKISKDPDFRKRESDLGHYAQHMINTGHCGHTPS